MTESEAPKEDWIVVCVGCHRMKRGDTWTIEVAQDLGGKSSGYCDRCAEEQRKRQSNTQRR